MKRYQNYESLPSHARYIGSEDGPGHTCCELEDAVDNAIDPVFIVVDGVKSFFELAA